MRGLFVIVGLSVLLWQTPFAAMIKGTDRKSTRLNSSHDV
jgi:hypothetical protein